MPNISTPLANNRTYSCTNWLYLKDGAHSLGLGWTRHKVPATNRHSGGSQKDFQGIDCATKLTSKCLVWILSFFFHFHRYAQGTAGDDVRKCRKNQHLNSSDVELISETINYSDLKGAIQSATEQIPQHLSISDTDSDLRDKLHHILMNPDVSPLLAKDHTGLPKAYILTCQQDVVRDEGFMYVKKLVNAGVEVQHDHKDAIHAFFDFQDLSFTQKAMAVLIEYIRHNFHIAK